MANDNLWMPLCVADYLADTTRLTTIQHGAYLLLLMDYWRNGPLPDDATQLMMIARSDRKTWARDIWPVVGAFFRLGADGRLHQKRADQELARASDITEKRRAAAQSRWRGNGRDDPPPTKDASAYANASPHEDANGDAKPQQTTSNGDAKSMHSRVRATHYTTPQKKEPPPTPPTASRQGGTAHPDVILPTNPRALGTNPRGQAQPKPRSRNGFDAILERLEQPDPPAFSVIDGDKIEEIGNAFSEFHRRLTNG